MEATEILTFKFGRLIGYHCQSSSYDFEHRLENTADLLFQKRVYYKLEILKHLKVYFGLSELRADDICQVGLDISKV